MKSIYLFVIVAFVSAYGCSDAAAQKKSTTKKATVTGGTTDGKWGLGLRLGDPLGLTVKKYFTNVAVEFNLGKTFYWGYNNSRFYNYYYYGYRNYPDYYYFNDARYGHRYYNQRALSMQLHILGQKKISSVPGLQLYFGAGPQLRTFSYDFEYFDRFRRSYYVTETQIGLGVDGVFGIEYTFKEVPITVFADINLYIEIIHNPLWITVQGGVGGRFNF